MDNLISRADALAVVMHSKDPVKDIQMLPGVGWIPVAERLPQECTPVLAYRSEFGGPYGDIVVGEYRQGHWYGCRGLGMTHWMPLPEPPKEGE